MRQKLLDGSDEPRSENKGVRLRAIARELGTFTGRQLVERAREEGIYSEEDYSRAALRGLEADARKHLKKKDSSGLQEFGPTPESDDDAPIWKQRRLWSVEDYRYNIEMRREKADSLRDEAMALVREAKQRYPRSKF